MEVLNAPTKSCILRSEPTSGGNRWFVYTKVGPETPGITKNDFRHIYAIIKYQRRNINLVSLFQYLLLPNYMEFHAIKYGRFPAKGRGSAGILCQRLYSPILPLWGRREGGTRGGGDPHGNSGTAGQPTTQGPVQPLVEKSRYLGSRE